MERVDGYGVNEGLPPENDKAVSVSHAPVVRRSLEGESPPLLAAYLGRIGRDNSSVETAMRVVAGTARSMGIRVGT